MNFPQSGGCLCGASRYRILDDPLLVYACHCTDCQTATGSAFALCVSVPLSQVETSGDPPSTRRVHLSGDRVWTLAVCPQCETRLWSERKGTPEIVTLRAGTLDDTSWAVPVGHIWVSSALPWTALGEGTLQHPQQPDDPTEMIRRWRNRSRDLGEDRK